MLESLENILKVGLDDSRKSGTENAYAVIVEQCDGLEKLELLQNHQNEKIFKKAYDIIENYFEVEDL